MIPALKDNPCVPTCPDRGAGCAATCDKYIQFRANRQQELQKQQQKVQQETMFRDVRKYYGKRKNCY